MYLELIVYNVIIYIRYNRTCSTPYCWILITPLRWELVSSVQHCPNLKAVVGGRFKTRNNICQIFIFCHFCHVFLHLVFFIGEILSDVDLILIKEVGGFWIPINDIRGWCPGYVSSQDVSLMKRDGLWCSRCCKLRARTALLQFVEYYVHNVIR